METITATGAPANDPVTITASTVGGDLVLNVSDTVAGTQIYQGTYFEGVAADISNLTLRGDPSGNTTFQITGSLGLSNANQTVTLPAGLTAGSFQLQFTPPGGGAAVTTAAINFNDSVAMVQAKINATPLNGNVIVGGAPRPGPSSSPTLWPTIPSHSSPPMS